MLIIIQGKFLIYIIYNSPAAAIWGPSFQEVMRYLGPLIQVVIMQYLGPLIQEVMQYLGALISGIFGLPNFKAVSVRLNWCIVDALKPLHIGR